MSALSGWSSPTVAVTGANSLVGRALLPRLKELGAEVSALVRAPTDLPAARVVTDWMTSPAALEALRGADAVVHLTGELFGTRAQYEAANVEPARRVAAALAQGRARRIVSISYPGADPGSRNDFLRTKGEAERLLAGSGVESVVFRVHALISTPASVGPFEEALIAPKPGAKVRTLGPGTQRIHPVYRPDAVEAVLAALVRGRPGVYDLSGPDLMTLDGLIRLLNRDPQVGIRHTPAPLARLLSRFVADLPPAFVDLMLRDQPGAPSGHVAREFGLNLTSLHQVWAPR